MCKHDGAPPAHRLSTEAKQLTWTSDLPGNCVLTLTAMHQERQTLHHRSLSSHHQVSTPTVVEPALISGLWLQHVTLSRGPKVLPGFANKHLHGQVTVPILWQGWHLLWVAS